MTIRDYLSKHGRTARANGIGRALYEAGTEAAMKAAQPIAQAKSTPIWADEWDVCLVLDGCRFDLWRDVAAQTDWLAGDGGQWSVGSASPEWLSNTFHPRHSDHLEQAGYVTANPFSGKSGREIAALDGDTFPLVGGALAYLDEVWRDEWPKGDDLPTVGPEALTERGLWAWEHRDVDQLVVHYMQPHIPFRSRREWCKGWDLDGFGTGGGHAEKDDWHRVRDGEIGRREFWSAYQDNLQWVLGEVQQWQRAIDGRVLVTSDHGNAMGEWGQWSHPPESGNPVLRRVPWEILEGSGVGSDRTATAPPESYGDAATDVDARLDALGYK